MSVYRPSRTDCTRILLTQIDVVNAQMQEALLQESIGIMLLIGVMREPPFGSKGQILPVAVTLGRPLLDGLADGRFVPV